jgi:serine/threonine protein kinase
MKTQRNIDEFLNEVVIISGVKHRNLVKLKGCCLRDNKKLLVYEYLENGDLANLLFGGQNGKEVLFWPTRFNICLGIARGLHYLHDISQPRIIHRDIKASNILLDKKLQPKIADFGLAFLFPDDKSHISTMHVAGTRGYLAPEYAARGQLTIKVDVYSFGVLLLEIISGRKNIDHNLPLDIYLVEKAWKLHREGNLIDIVDQNLHLLNDETIQAQRLLNITLLCLLNDGEKRPSMARVVAMLQGEVDSGIVENDLTLGRSNMKLPPSSLSSLESELELCITSEGSETSSLVLYNHSNASMNATSSNIEHLHY